MVFPWLGIQSKHQRGYREPGSALDKDEASHKRFIQTSIKRVWKAPRQAVAKSTQNEQEMLHPDIWLPTGQEAQRVLQRVSSEQWKQTMYAGSFKNDCKESPELLFCAFFGFLFAYN